MRAALILFVNILVVAASIWSSAGNAQASGPNSYIALVEDADGKVKRCGIEYFFQIDKDSAGHDLIFKVGSATEVMNGNFPVVYFSVEAVRATGKDSGEVVKVSDAAIEAGTLKTRGSSMKRPSGEVDAYIITSLSQDEMLPLSLFMANGSRLFVRLEGDKNERTYELPRATDATTRKIIDCFDRMATLLAAAADDAAKAKGR